MKKILTSIIGAVLISALSGFAAYTDPTPDQIAAVAGGNSQLQTTLLQGASAEQAAQFIKAVIIAIANLGLDSQAAGARIALAVTTGFSAFPTDSAPLLASSLGTACGATLAISGNATVVSIVQGSVVTAGGSGGAALAEAFGSAFTDAQTLAAKSTNKDAAPPVTKSYDGQK